MGRWWSHLDEKRFAGKITAQSAAHVEAVNAALVEMYGTKNFPGPRNPLEGLVHTILSQNTNRVNFDRAFAELVRRFPSWDAAAAAPPEEIEDAIRSGGLANQKSKHISAILRDIVRTRGSASLDWLADVSNDEALAYLRSFRGVGPKTAACVLLFSLGREVFPVDTHIYRIAERLGWMPPGLSDQAAHDFLETLIPGHMRYQLHMNLVEHGRKTCKARKPRCAECACTSLCEYYLDDGFDAT